MTVPSVRLSYVCGLVQTAKQKQGSLFKAPLVKLFNFFAVELLNNIVSILKMSPLVYF